MKTGIVIATAAVLMIGVWSSFFYVLFAEPERLSWANNQPERVEVDREIREIPIISSDTDSFEESNNTKQDFDNTVISPNRSHTLDPSEFPIIKHGDGIGYGKGISVDDLLEDRETFDN